MTPDYTLARAQEMLAPYQISFKVCQWFSAYHIGEEVVDLVNRILHAGGVVRTHSPKYH